MADCTGSHLQMRLVSLDRPQTKILSTNCTPHQLQSRQSTTIRLDVNTERDLGTKHVINNTVIAKLI